MFGRDPKELAQVLKDTGFTEPQLDRLARAANSVYQACGGDLPRSNSRADMVDFVFGSGTCYMEMYGENHFGPDGKEKRADFKKFLTETVEPTLRKLKIDSAPYKRLMKYVFPHNSYEGGAC